MESSKTATSPMSPQHRQSQPPPAPEHWPRMTATSRHLRFTPTHPRNPRHPTKPPQPPPTPFRTGGRGSHVQRYGSPRPPCPRPPHLTTAFPPTPQPVSPSPATPATRAKRPPETPKRSPTSPGTYTSWTRAVSIGSDVLPGPPPPTPTDGPPSCPHPQGVHPPQVPLSEIHLPTYAQPAPTEADAAPVHDLVASFEAMSLKGAAFDPFSRSTTDRAPASGTSPAFQLTPPPTAGLRPPDPPTPSLVPLEASADVSLWGSPGLALGSSPSPSPMLVPPSTPLRAPSSYSQRSASFPSPSPGPDRPTISRSARTTPFQSPFVSSPNSPFFGPHAPALPRPSAEIRNNPSPGLSPWCPAPDSPPLDPIPLPRTWRCSICTLSNTNTTCEACGAVAPQWTCPQCTLHNDHHAVECGACGAANTLLTRPVSPQQLSPTSPLSPLSPLCRTQAKRVEPIEGVGLGIRRGDTDRDIPSAATPNHGSWMCPLCTYGNEPVDKCEMCNTPRP
ncbi:uncharacterized protein COLE_03554 [Cutaneotrichosporon oleaginosum]|uniref:uncharacterized protein n=1 Tax=Cutaneotrichosporon oleaginosum TaxID=879819 RepID=UPI001325B78E|nr:hypothetical protein COLE_03554 [Cutaneotrichosporon oleaginosum]